MRKSFTRNEEGLVSILVTMIMMIVISLIIVGFAQVTQRNSREALDNQLSTAAYYAAESGVDDAVTYLSSHPNYAQQAADPTTCNNFVNSANSNGGQLQPKLTSDGSTAYTCLLVNTHPTSLLYNNVKMGTNTVLKLASGNGTIGSFQFSFTQDSNAPSSAANPNCSTDALGSFKAQPQRCNFGILRIDLFPGNVSVSAASGAVGLASATKTIYLQPVATIGTNPNVNFFDPNGPSAYAFRCKPAIDASTQKNTCTATINVSSASSTSFYARLSMMYVGADSVSVSGSIGGSSSTPVQFTGGQAVIDSTGKSQDEVRRLQVRVPLFDSNAVSVPANALQTTQSICKHFQVVPGVSPVDPSATCPS